MRRGRPRSKDRGASLVEFALVLPLLTLFLFGIVQFGIAYDMKQSINSAAREGSRTGAIPANTVNDVEAAVDNSFDGLVNTGDVTTTIYIDDDSTSPITGATTQPCDGNAGHTVIVVSNVDYDLTIPFFGSRNLTLTGRGEFRCERSS